MAVSIENNVITLGTQADAVDAWLDIKEIRWEGGTTADHKCTLTQTSGKEIVDFTMPTAVGDQSSDGPGWVKGVIVSDLDSGNVKLFVR
jgi:hypothetical protein